MGRASAVLHR